MEQTRTDRRPFRYETLDHWRGVACLFVVVYHSTILYLEGASSEVSRSTAAAVGHWLLQQTHKLNVGVPLFFVISGYCIAAAAESVRRRGSAVSEYFFRRFRRIYPPLWAAIALGLALFALLDYWPVPGLLSREPWMQPRPTWYTPSQWLGNITLTETWRHYFFGATRAHFPGQAWTLCYEEQFYLVTGLLLLWCRGIFYSGIGLVTLGTIAGMWVAHATGTPINGFFFDGAWLLFAAGVGVFYRLSTPLVWQKWTVDALLAVGIALAWWTGTPNDGVVAFAFAGLLIFLHRFDKALSRAPLLAPIRICGEMCYSLYLVHQLPVRAVSMSLAMAGLTSWWATILFVVPMSVGVALALGWAFHVTVERRFLNAMLPSVPIVVAPSIPIGVTARLSE